MDTKLNFSPHICHEHLFRSAPKVLRFDPSVDYASWKQPLRMKLQELVGDIPEAAPLNIRVEYEREHDGFRETRFVFTSEPYSDVPCHLLVPKGINGPVPVVICLQGHSPGMHISLGRPNEGESVDGGRDFAVQAVREGYAALALEQRCFGERPDGRLNGNGAHKNRCTHSTMAALLLGRTMIGERVWDVSRAIDALAEFHDVDTSRVACMGNSGGGTVTWYAACLDERISVAMPSCSICTYADSIGSIDHCVDNYVPFALKYFDMPDLAGLIAPRPLVVVAGREDPIFPIKGVEEAMETISRIYAAAGVPDRCKLVVGDSGHQFYPEQAWPVFREMMGK